jgi:hypothetical protein
MPDFCKGLEISMQRHPQGQVIKLGDAATGGSPTVAQTAFKLINSRD